MRDLFKYIFVVMFLSSLTSCYQADSSFKGRPEDPWAKRAWIEKTARSLRYGEGISPSEDIEALMAMSKDQIIDYFMKDTRFLDTVIDFNLFYLGLKNGPIYSLEVNGSRNYSISNRSPKALASARAVWERGDYFKLYSFEQPFYFDGRFEPANNNSQNPDKKSDREFRLEKLNLILADHQLLLEAVKEQIKQGGSQEKFCERFIEIEGKIDENFVNSTLPNQITQNFTGIFSSFFDLQIACFIPQTINYSDFLSKLTQRRDRIVKLLAIVDHPSASSPQIIKSPLDMLAFENGDYGVESKPDIFSFESWFSLPNSSTNYNRKRAAYVLKTYFCDDLTPINIALPSSHAGNKHADDPSCASCHYKMDPMAGFFRHKGIFGVDLEGKNMMIFDDQAVVQNEKYSQYMSTWKAASESGREWNIGYIRSAKDPRKNSYGESIADLMKIIRSSSEVKQCLTKRMTEYFLGVDQVYDAGWVNAMAQKFEAADKSQEPGASSQAFKEVVKNLLLSNTFVKQDPEKNQCYDYAPGHEPSNLPCEVSFLINKNCSQCHNASGASGGLDLTSWVKIGSDESNFSHISSDGNQQPKKYTFDKLIESLSTSDEGKLMPLNKFMSPTERAQIYKWIQREAITVPGGRP